MISKLFLSAISLLTLISCNNNRPPDQPKPETPKALEDKSSSYEIGRKKGYDDLVENLYAELVSKDVNLQRLEDMVDGLNSSENDSTAAFDKFNQKNESYFNSADRRVSGINDSLLKDKMKLLVADQLAKYKARIAGDTSLLEIIRSKQLTIADLQHVLRIVKTLPVIDKYQQDNHPSKKPLEEYIKQQERAIRLADSLSGK